MAAAAIPLVISGLGALSGFLKKKQDNQFDQQTQTNTSGWQNRYDANELNSILQNLFSQTGRTATTTAPTLGGPQQELLDQLTRQYSNLATRGANLAPYEAGQIRNINRNADLQSKAVQNIMASRGLSTSPVSGTADANVQANRFSRISDFQASLPLLQQQLQLQNLGGAQGFLSSIPRGVSTTGETNLLGESMQTGQQTGVSTSDINTGGWSGTTASGTGQQAAGGGIGGAAGSVASILAALFGMGAFGGKK